MSSPTKIEVIQSSSHTTELTANLTTDKMNKDEDEASSSRNAASDGEFIDEAIPYNKDYRFWLIMLTLCFSVTLASLESTVVITSLPTIVEKLDLGKNYIWVANAYFLSR